MCVCVCVCARVVACVGAHVWVPANLSMCTCVHGCSLDYPACNTLAPRLIILSFVASLAVLYFSTLSRKQHSFRKRLLNAKYVFLFSLQILFKSFLILIRIQRDIVINVIMFPCKLPVIREILM